VARLAYRDGRLAGRRLPQSVGTARSTPGHRTSGRPGPIPRHAGRPRDPDEHCKSEERKHLPIEEKESMKWLNTFARVAEVQALCPVTLLVSMGDRESDIHDLFTLAARDPAGPKLLVRAERTRQRRVENEALWDFISRQSPAGEITLHIPRRGNRPTRTVVLSVRFAEVTLQPPRACRRAWGSTWWWRGASTT
jgi:hypothetical protein